MAHSETKYGITPKGPNIKRLDKIINELHDDLSIRWNVNTRLNPQSFLNVQITAFADKLAELWEFGEQVYHSMYPFSAEGISLDNAVQFGGISREEARPTIYPIHCECVEGTIIPTGTRIRTNTNPSIDFLTTAHFVVSRGAFNKIKIRIAVVQPEGVYTIVLNGITYSSRGKAMEYEILTELAGRMKDPNFMIEVADSYLLISSVEPQRQHNIILSSNMTTETVTAIIPFASEAMGEIALPNGTITEIVASVTGLLTVENRIRYIAGRLLENNIELRMSYANKIYHRSNRMLESIKSAILQNVQGVNSVAAFQNDRNVADEYGRWPHSIEVVVDGGSDYEIAVQIREKKAGGIQTFGSVEVVVPGEHGEPMVERFNRPVMIYVWFRIVLTINPHEKLPTNYAESIRAIVMSAMQTVVPGQIIVPQRLIEALIYSSVPGIGLIETSTFATADVSEQPNAEMFTAGPIEITPRQKAVTQESRIEVILSG